MKLLLCAGIYGFVFSCTWIALIKIRDEAGTATPDLNMPFGVRLTVSLIWPILFGALLIRKLIWAIA